MTNYILVRITSGTGPTNPCVTITPASPPLRFVLEAYIRKRGINTSAILRRFL